MNNYKMIIQGFDFGPCVSKLIIDWGQPPATPAPEDFTVSVIKEGSFSDAAPILTGTRKITAAYMEGTQLILEMEVSPLCNIGHALMVDHVDKGPDRPYSGQRWANPYEYKLSYKGQDYPLVCAEIIREIADLFDYGDFESTDGIKLQYAHFTPPEATNSKRPLIIWLHGAWEGTFFGAHPANIAIMGNKAVALADTQIQKIMQGAHVLAPQTPTMWMDDGSGMYTKDGTSMYEAALAELIDAKINNCPSIDPSRVYIGGCSNGGFMTLKMLFARPGLFAAAFPVCHGYNPAWITDEMINRIKHIPIWQIHSWNDTVFPGSFADDVHKKLLAAGAADTVCSVYDKVEDVTGKWKDESGKPWVYDAHATWVPVFNNDVSAVVDGNEIRIFEWMAGQVRK